jgi:spore coat protein A, manganese oxidase
MKISRNRFLKGAAGLGMGALFLAVSVVGSVGDSHAFNQSPQIPLFQTALRAVGPGGIPVAAPSFLPAPVTGVTHYDILISQFMDDVLPNKVPYNFGKTTLWGYNPVFAVGGGFQPQKHLGGIIVAKGRNPNDATEKNIPIQITFRNLLFVNKHILPVDTTQQDPSDAYNATAIHLHGGLVPWISDGGPFDWFGPTGKHGLSFLNNKVLNPFALPGSADYYYPMNQSARFMWYHDHAHGITRLNAYAGIASAMLIRDNFEKGLMDGTAYKTPGVKGLPPYIETSVLSAGKIPIQELPLVFQDKIFVGQNIGTNDQSWSSEVQIAATKPGSLWYAHTYEANQLDGTGRWDLGAGGGPLPEPSVIPEFFGDTMLVNGTAYPDATVQARRYRLRMLNATNARFLNLQLYVANNTADGITLDPATGSPINTPFVNGATNDSSWLQIGTEGGFLSKPAKIPSNQPFGYAAGYPGPDPVTGQTDPSQILKSLLVAPAERPDLIVDFSKYPAGTKIVLYNDAPAPFPSGDDRNDYFPGWNVGSGLFGVGNPVNGTTTPGSGPNTRVLMRFTVAAATGSDTPLTIDTTTNLTNGIDKALLVDSSQNPAWVNTRLPLGVAAVKTKTLNEYFDDRGRLVQILGNDANASSLFGTPLENNAGYLGYPTAVPTVTDPNPLTTVGSTEENVKAGDTEVWEVFNTTGDVHPMHFHLVNVQLVNRQVYSTDPTGAVTFPGAPIAPDFNELGWKETVPMYPGTVTRVIMKWSLKGSEIVDRNLRNITIKPTLLGKLLGQEPITAGMPPQSPRTGGFEYVWHCHILEHEEHDMMHAVVVTP